MTSSPAFLRESPLATARRYVDRSLRGANSPAEIAWLHANPLMWLRALQGVHRDIQYHVGKDRAHLERLKPKPGEQPSPAYIDAKAELETRAAARLHVMQIAERRIAEVKALIGPGPLPPYLTVGDLIEVFTDIAMLADGGDLAAAADKAMFHAKKLKAAAKEQRL